MTLHPRGLPLARLLRPARAVTERLGFDRRARPPQAEDLGVLLPTDEGPLWFPRGDQFITPFVRDHGTWEPRECELIRGRLRPGNSFIDVGAHTGYLAIVAANVVGPGGWGLAVEAAPNNFALLRKNLDRAGVKWVQAVHAAAGDVTGGAIVSFSEDNTGDHRAYAIPGRRAAAIPAKVIDDLVPDDQAVDFVKIDVQGTDHRVVRGLRRLLLRWGPTILVEYWPAGIEDAGDDPEEVVEFYRGLGLDIRCLDTDGLGLNPGGRQLAEAARNNRGNYCSLIMTPRERLQERPQRTAQR